MKETKRYPTRRCQEVIEYDDGSRKRICYSNNCPHYYQDETGRLRAIDLGLREKHSAKVGKHHVRDRNVVSVGFRDDDKAAKFLGFRPDVNQALGTEQLEFSVQSIQFDGREQAVDLERNEAVDALTTRLGSILVRSSRQRTRQLVVVDRPITGFEIVYTLHVKGLKVEERAGEFWFFSEADGEFRFRICKPCLCDEDFQPRQAHEWGYPHIGECSRCGDCCRLAGCKHFVEADNSCAIYDDRPEVCRTYPQHFVEPLPGCTIRHPLQELDWRQPLVEHSLADNGDGTWTYTKKSTDLFSEIAEYLPGTFYVDADVYYSTTADGAVELSVANGWDACHDAETGGTVYDTSTTLNGISATYGGKTYYGMCRSFFYFDTTGASSPSAVDLLVYGATNARSDAEAQKGTQADSLSAADYDAFSGTEYGHVSWAIGSYNTISFDSTGVNEIVTDGISKICCREYTHDYGDSQPSSGYQNGCYYADETGTDKDPYLEITEGAAVGIPYYYYAQEQAAALCG